MCAICIIFHALVFDQRGEKKNSREHAFPCQRFHANALTWPHASLKSAVNHWLPVYLWSHPMRSHSTSPRSQGFDRLTIASHLSATVRPRQKRTFGIIRQRNRYWSRYHVWESRMSVFFRKEFSRKTYKSKGPMQRMCEKKKLQGVPGNKLARGGSQTTIKWRGSLLSFLVSRALSAFSRCLHTMPLGHLSTFQNLFKMLFIYLLQFNDLLVCTQVLLFFPTFLKWL